MSDTVKHPVIPLPGNTLLYSEVHAAVLDVAEINHIHPKNITIYHRGEHTHVYDDFVLKGGRTEKEQLVGTRKSTVAIYTLFPYDEFIIEFDNGAKIKFMTPELISIQRKQKIHT